MKMILLSLAGLLLCLTGIYIMYLYITGLNTHASIFFLISSLLLIGSAIFLLVFAQKSDTMILKRAGKEEADNKFVPIIIPPKAKDEGLKKQITQNNAMIKDWEKTNETQQRLKMLEMQAGVEDGK
jgi:hypothetical protein